jgi:predicted regulator of Ras-like GTPase activity (Roadblock/LC7/MglB family)
MALESYLDRFKKINGYKASAIMNFTGEILAQDSNDPQIDLGMVGATFNDIFRTAHSASDKIGLEACREATISTPKGIIIMRCSGVKSKVHYHTIAIFTADGNQALAKMEMEKMIPAVMDELG